VGWLLLSGGLAPVGFGALGLVPANVNGGYRRGARGVGGRREA
jgi:hypothetical protein